MKNRFFTIVLTILLLTYTYQFWWWFSGRFVNLIPDYDFAQINTAQVIALRYGGMNETLIILLITILGLFYLANLRKNG